MAESRHAPSPLTKMNRAAFRAAAMELAHKRLAAGRASDALSNPPHFWRSGASLYKVRNGTPLWFIQTNGNGIDQAVLFGRLDRAEDGEGLAVLRLESGEYRLVDKTRIFRTEADARQEAETLTAYFGGFR